MISRYFYRQVTSEMNTYFFMTSRNKAARGLRAIPFLLGLLMLLPVAAHAQREMYGRLNTADSTLTLYYDENMQGGDYPANAGGGGYNQPHWQIDQVRTTTKTVVFDPGFKDARPTTCFKWFCDFEKLEHFQGMDNLNTSEVTNMNLMFAGCKRLDSLDLSNFNVEMVEDMGNMFLSCEKLTSLDLSHFNLKNLRSMHAMFDKCRAMTSVKLPKSDTKNVANLVGLFYYCQNLEHIEGLENLNTSEVTSMRNMFQSCEKLTTLDLSHFDTGKVTDMTYMFNNCYSLKSLVIDSFDTRNVTSFEQMFCECHSLTSLNLSSFDTGSATDMMSMFSGCKSLESLDLSSFNTGNVTEMRGMFEYCSSLENINLSSFNVEKVQSMNSMFHGCSKLASLDLSHFNTKSLSFMTAMFSGCTSLGSLDLSSFNTESVYSMSYLFRGCTSLASVDLSSFVTDKLKYMAYMFQGCGNLKTIYASSAFTTANLDQSDVADKAFDGCTSLPNYDSNKTGKELARIGEGGYFTVAPAWVRFDEGTGTLTFRCSTAKTDADTDYSLNEGRDTPGWNAKAGDIKTVTFTRSFRDVRPTDCSMWFYKCENLTRIDGMENLNTSEATDMQYMFNGCKKLDSLDLSGFSTANITSMQAMFKGCSGLTALNLSGFSGSQVTTTVEMFSGCTSLAAVSLAQFDTPELKEMDKMFQNCSALTSLDLSSFSLGEVNFDKGISGNQLFDYCTSLKTVYVGDSLKFKDGLYMFRGCGNLRGAIAYVDGKYGVEQASYVSGYLTKKVGTNGDDIIGATGEPLTVETLQLDDSKAYALNEPCRVKNAAYTRPMKAEWGTLCLPYDFDTDSDGDSCLFYALSEVGENSVTLEELRTSRVTAGYPVIVRKKDAGREEISVKHAARDGGAQLVTAPTGETAGNRLVGTFATALLADDCYFLANDKFRLVGDYKQVASGVKLAAFRAYIQPQQQTAAQRAPVLSINMDGETSAIDAPAVVGALNDAATEYYDMNGRRTDGLQKGMNIVKTGGRVMKVLVK